MKDTNGNIVTSTPVLMAADGEYNFTPVIECKNGYELTAVFDNPDVTVEGKANPGDTFVDIVATPIDVSSYAGQSKIFYLRLITAADAAASKDIIEIVHRRAA